VYSRLIAEPEDNDFRAVADRIGGRPKLSSNFEGLGFNDPKGRLLPPTQATRPYLRVRSGTACSRAVRWH